MTTSSNPVQFIDKIAFIYLKDGKALCSRNKGNDTWYLPGGKREENETDEVVLIREVKEELSVDVLPETIKAYGVFTAQAHGKPEGTKVRMTCYTATFNGEPKPDNEIDELAYFGYDDDFKKSPVDVLIFDDLHKKGLLK
jgi:8-oxo-dGTP diphosphatase